MADAQQEYEPSYRQRDVDNMLAEHEKRLTRLEKIALLGLGYGLASGAEIITNITQLL